MTRYVLEDALLDRVEIRANSAPNHLLTVIAWQGDVAPGDVNWAVAADMPGVGSLFRLSSWLPVAKMAECAAQGRDWSFNTQGFYFAENRDLGDTEFPEVMLVDFRYEVMVSRAAFDRLCTKLFEALHQVAFALAPEVLISPWWPDFEKNARTVAQRTLFR